MGKIAIYDTTLRDGSQGEGISFSVEDKFRIAKRLDKFGVDYVECGWPGSNPKDMELFRQLQGRKFKHAKVTAFSSTRKPDILPEEDSNMRAILESGVKVATLFGKSWDFHVTTALNTTLGENLSMIRDSVAYLVASGLEVIYDAEHFFDGYKNNPEYALATLKAAEAGGATTLVLCDTNGGSMPDQVTKALGAVRGICQTPLGIHTHNDCELAVANSIAAVKAGARHVQGTINGIGERCGNANLCTLIPNLTLKMGHETVPETSLKYLTELSYFVYELANMLPAANQPYVGGNAFAHKGGVHVNALLKDSRTYEHIIPETIGNRRRVLVSELSGMSNLLYKYKELNLDLGKSEEGKKLLEEIKEMEKQGFQFESAGGSFELLLRKIHNQGYQQPFNLENLRIIIEMREREPVRSEATIKLKVGDETVHTAAEGSGPVNALDNALRKALGDFYPRIREMHLNDYKVRVLDERAGTGAVVRVLIQSGDGKRSWGTVGVSANIIEASWQALVDSIAYGLLDIMPKTTNPCI